MGGVVLQQKIVQAGFLSSPNVWTVQVAGAAGGRLNIS